MADQSQGKKKEGKRLKQLNPAVGWTLFGIAVAVALAMAITMCVIGMR